ncbi:unnamed protein product [Trichogramma brassicae]|uniref:non-specific protein-tyrosine kinase n=1 Tax=Trichogramma brassicae TaxID=86971 RepID=A0A6H5IWH3_9HYME|nr:unnamed protein product [Trichogramma brassicae]
MRLLRVICLSAASAVPREKTGEFSSTTLSNGISKKSSSNSNGALVTTNFAKPFFLLIDINGLFFTRKKRCAEFRRFLRASSNYDRSLKYSRLPAATTTTRPASATTTTTTAAAAAAAAAADPLPRVLALCHRQHCADWQKGSILFFFFTKKTLLARMYTHELYSHMNRVCIVCVCGRPTTTMIEFHRCDAMLFCTPLLPLSLLLNFIFAHISYAPLQSPPIHAQLGMSRNTGPGLYEFLMEAELQQYYSGIRGDLKVHNPAQLKYVTEDDLGGIGMTKPEMRRLKKYFQRHFPQNYLSKFKKMLLPRKDDAQQLAGALGQGLPEERQDRPPVRVPNKHMIPADAIIVNKELGTGEFGVVQQGVWTNDGERIQVAIKCLSRERMQNNPIEFLKEAAIMHSIDHEHIVRLYGVVLDTSSLMLVTELAPLRSLLECLKEPQLRSSFPVPSLCDFAVQIADGMQYLEAKRLIHRDLAARNILVFSKNKVKISDFGLSRALGVGKDYYQTNFNVNLKLPIAWCAPECISYLKFTSASDVWAYGVTLWEMFSYGFQPWAALTGHQILEAIDEPNYQRLEQPDCCPKDYFNLMQKCWQHEPTKRPKFSEIIALLPDLKPEQVQAVQDTNEIGMLVYKQNDVITVLDKGCSNTMWKGVLANGKTGFFNPAHTIAYLGGNLPSNVKPGEFQRGGGTDGKNGGIFSSQRRKIRTDMISSPQGDLKHTGHVGLDGAYFGDLSFLGGKYPHLPRQVVTPYKPQEDATDNNSSHHHHHHHHHQHHEAGGGTLRERTNGDGSHNNRDSSIRDSRSLQHNSLWSDSCSEISQMGSVNTINNMPANMVSSTDSSTICGDHEYHEISDEENQESPLRFDKPLSFDFGPSLMDEMDQMFRSLDSLNLGASPNPPPAPAGLQQQQSSIEQHESSNARNELREIQSKQTGKRKQATVKPISAADQKTLYSAIAMAQEITARSMTDLETQHHQEVGGGNNANNGGGGGGGAGGAAAGSAGSISGGSSSQQHARHGSHYQGGGGGSGHSPRTPSSPTTTHRRKFSFKLPHQHSPKPDRRHFSEEAASIPDIQWLCTSLQSLSSTVSSIESLGAPSTLKLPLWDKASAEFCFAKSRELLTKPNPAYWSSYCSDDMDYDPQDLMKSTEFLENGNGHHHHDHHHHRKSIASCLEFDQLQQLQQLQQQQQQPPPPPQPQPIKQNGAGKVTGNGDYDFPRDSGSNNKRVSTSYVDRYFEQPKYDEGDHLSYEDELRINELEQTCRKAFMANYDNNHRAAGGGGLIMNNDSAAKIVSLNKFDLGARPKNEQQQQFMGSPRHQLNGHSNGHADQQQQQQQYPYAISNNPIFNDDGNNSGRPGLVGLQRRKSDADCNQLYSSHQSREVSGLESVKNYLESKKAQQQQSGLNLGFSKLTQNMIQLGKNIAQNTRHLGGGGGGAGVNENSNSNGHTKSGGGPVLQKPNHLDLKQQSNGGSPSLQRILDPPKLYQNNDRKLAEIAKTEILVERLQAFRPRTSSLSENRRPHAKNFRRSFHQTSQQEQNDSSDDSDSISHSETDIRGRLRMKRRHRRGMRLNFKNQKAAAARQQQQQLAQNNFLHPDMARRSNFDLHCDNKSSTSAASSFLSSLQGMSSRSSLTTTTSATLTPQHNNLHHHHQHTASWPESAPSSSITFTSNSDLDSDSSSEYPEFCNDVLTFPPSPAP